MGDPGKVGHTQCTHNKVVKSELAQIKNLKSILLVKEVTVSNGLLYIAGLIFGLVRHG